MQRTKQRRNALEPVSNCQVRHHRSACLLYTSEHHRAAHSAEQLGGEQIIVLGLVTGRSAAVLLDFLLYFFKQVLVHDGRDAVGHHNVLEVVFSDVPFVRTQLLNTVVCKLLIAVGGHATVAVSYTHLERA